MKPAANYFNKVILYESDENIYSWNNNALFFAEYDFNNIYSLHQKTVEVANSLPEYINSFFIFIYNSIMCFIFSIHFISILHYSMMLIHFPSFFISFSICFISLLPVLSRLLSLSSSNNISFFILIISFNLSCLFVLMFLCHYYY